MEKNIIILLIKIYLVACFYISSTFIGLFYIETNHYGFYLYTHKNVSSQLF